MLVAVDSIVGSVDLGVCTLVTWLNRSVLLVCQMQLVILWYLPSIW